ncbi:MAG: glycosyltransferase family 8 protein [Planctomycetota bacterium]|nr:glycosyltransferase family 8 protein [Planctomycetota bacterium]
MKIATSPNDEVAIVVAADNGYAMPLAVAVRSVIDTLGENKHLKAYIIDGGISDENRKRCLASWESFNTSIVWLKPEKDLLNQFVSSDHFTVATYYRLFVSELLPSSLPRVIYLDPDMLCMESVSQIYNIDLHGNPIAAAQDVYCPFIDNRIAMGNYSDAMPYVYGLVAIPDADERKTPPTQPYFNAGLLVMDLDQFRKNKIADTLRDYCIRFQGNLLWADQCAANACLGYRWTQLDNKWNVTTPVFEVPSHSVTFYDQQTFERIKTKPACIHFAGPKKPWHFGSDHPFVNSYFDMVDKTDWRGWRPVHEAREVQSSKSGFFERLLKILPFEKAFNRKAA